MSKSGSMQSNTVRVRVDFLDDGRLVARVAGCAAVLESDDIVDLREKVDLLIRATYGEHRPISLLV